MQASLARRTAVSMAYHEDFSTRLTPQSGRAGLTSQSVSGRNRQDGVVTSSASQKLRIVFAGTPPFARSFLQLLIEQNHRIVGVYTRPDRPAGRGKKLRASPVKQLALEHGLAVFQPVHFRGQRAREQLAALDADLMVVVAYGLILPQVVLDTPRQGCINVHASPLPRWRGAAPVQRAIESGDRESGVTIMQMDAGLDTGDMLNRATCPIDHRDTAASLQDKLADVGKPVLLASLDAIATGRLSPFKQDDSAANYAHKIGKIEGLVNWQLSAQILDRKIRAFYPFPVAYSQFEGRRIKIHRALVLANHSRSTPGQIDKTSDQGIDVQTGCGTLRIERLQIPGKKAMHCADILRGYPGLFAEGKSFGCTGGEPP